MTNHEHRLFSLHPFSPFPSLSLPPSIRSVSFPRGPPKEKKEGGGKQKAHKGTLYYLPLPFFFLEQRRVKVSKGCKEKSSSTCAFRKPTRTRRTRRHGVRTDDRQLHHQHDDTDRREEKKFYRTKQRRVRAFG